MHAIEVTRFRPWTDVDALTVFKLALVPTIVLDDIDRTIRFEEYRAAGAARGFDGTALFFGDVERTAPFDRTSVIPDALQKSLARQDDRGWRSQSVHRLDAQTSKLARGLMARVRSAPLAAGLLLPRESADRGSNAWVVSGRFTASGRPLLASDPHFALTQPSTFYMMHLEASAAGIDFIGLGLPGIPYLVVGNNQHLAFGFTAGNIDVVDIYRETVVPDPGSPSGLSTKYRGTFEPIVKLPQTFRINTPGDGSADNLAVASGPGIPAEVLIVPRRNDGPILQFDAETGVALSFQWTGSSGTRELEAFRGFNRARSMVDVARALEFFDSGSQNMVVADIRGNIGYFLTGEVPLREDLQAGDIAGAPPMFIRNGEGGNEWIRATSADPTRAVPFEIVPAAEMPRLINPPRGFIVTANNDPDGATLDNDPFNQKRPGGGISYLGISFAPGVRAGRIDELLEERIRRRGRLTAEDMTDIQADTVMNDARVFTPFILKAFANARRPGAHPTLARLAGDPRVAEAVARLGKWDHSTPTGIPEGYDANDAPGRLNQPGAEEVSHSVAATIFSVWRNQLLRSVVLDPLASRGLRISGLRRDPIATARYLLEGFDRQRGIGASGLNFFDVPGIDDAATRRDVIILRGLARTLDLLAGDAFADAFARSTNQDDYRWGRLHRVIFDHPLGAPFSVPPAGGAFPQPLPGLPGIPVDGGMLSVDVANNMVPNMVPSPDDADSPASFVVRFGPVQRYVARARSFGQGFESEASQAGGASAVPGSPFYVNLLEEWLTNRTHPLRRSRGALFGNSAEVQSVLPVRTK